MALSRRQLLATGAAGALAATARADGPRRAFRVAHITDVHITPGAAAMFAHLAKNGPDLVLNTVDCVMAVNGDVTGEQAGVQIDLWKAAVKACPVPIYSCLGNHNVWDGAGPTAAVPAAKKVFALLAEVLGMPAPYYSFDRGGWHFVALNSVSSWPDYGAFNALPGRVGRGASTRYHQWLSGADARPLTMSVGGRRRGAAATASRQSRSTSTSPPDGSPVSTPTFRSP